MTITSCPMCEWEIPGEQTETIKSCAECGADLSRWTARKIKPPPIPVQFESESSGGERFARRAAIFSIVAPVIAIALFIVGPLVLALNVSSRHDVHAYRIGTLIIVCTAFLLILSGLVLGIVALVLPKKGGGQGIIASAIVGLCFNGFLILALFIGISVLNKIVERVRERQEQRQEQRQ